MDKMNQLMEETVASFKTGKRMIKKNPTIKEQNYPDKKNKKILTELSLAIFQCR
jgi:hypothetical protein